MRRGAGVVELDALEKRCAFTGTVGSNPTLSARNAKNDPCGRFSSHPFRHVLAGYACKLVEVS
jgi:hypothetical protein